MKRLLLVLFAGLLLNAFVFAQWEGDDEYYEDDEYYYEEPESDVIINVVGDDADSQSMHKLPTQQPIYIYFYNTLQTPSEAENTPPPAAQQGANAAKDKAAEERAVANLMVAEQMAIREMASWEKADRMTEQRIAEEKAALRFAEERAYEERLAERRAAEERAYEERVAERRFAEERAAERRAAERMEAEEWAAEKRAAERIAAERRAAERKAAEERIIEIEESSVSAAYGRVRVIPAMPNPNSSRIYRLQVGAYSTRSTADRIAKKLKSAGLRSGIERYNSLQRVFVSGVRARDVGSMVQKLGALGFEEIWVRE